MSHVLSTSPLLLLSKCLLVSELKDATSLLCHLAINDIHKNPLNPWLLCEILWSYCCRSYFDVLSTAFEHRKVLVVLCCISKLWSMHAPKYHTAVSTHCNALDLFDVYWCVMVHYYCKLSSEVCLHQNTILLHIVLYCIVFDSAIPCLTGTISLSGKLNNEHDLPKLSIFHMRGFFSTLVTNIRDLWQVCLYIWFI